MATQKSLTEIVCDAVKTLQERKGSRLKQIFSYAKEVTQNNEEITIKKIKLALKNAIDKEMLHRTKDGRFNLNLPDVPNKNVKNTDVQQLKNEDDNFIAESCCPKRRRRRICRRRRKKCRSRRRRKVCRRPCTKMWVPKRKRRCRSTKRRRRSCKRRRKRRCCNLDIFA